MTVMNEKEEAQNHQITDQNSKIWIIAKYLFLTLPYQHPNFKVLRKETIENERYIINRLVVHCIIEPTLLNTIFFLVTPKEKSTKIFTQKLFYKQVVWKLDDDIGSYFIRLRFVSLRDLLQISDVCINYD